MKARVADYMATNMASLAPEDDIVDAMRMLLARDVSGAPVVDSEGRLLGILSQKDCFEIVYRSAYHQDWSGQVEQYMSHDPETIEADCGVLDAADRFLRSSYRRFPVLRDGELVGLLSRRDILRALDELYLAGSKRG